MRKIICNSLILLTSFVLVSAAKADDDVMAELIWVEKVNTQYYVMLSEMHIDKDAERETWSDFDIQKRQPIDKPYDGNC